ncbi:MAG: DEAD/DEAH box helicase, partial [Planctomycetes bacterium]|nr:DEAD/DEAH box helicase [Planctomycetota bacterium]
PADWEGSLAEQPGGWFALSVGFDLDGERLDHLPILPRLLEDGTLDMLDELSDRSHHLVYLPDGGALHIPADRLKRILRQLASLVDPNRPFLHPVDAAHLASRSELSLEPAGNLANLTRQLGDLRKPSKAEPPPGVQATLRDYQLEGYRWLQTLARCQLNGILADDMGLGKTLQTLTHILTENTSGRAGGRPSLVVAPTSVVPNWKAEAARFIPSLSVLVLQGPKRRRDFGNIPFANLVLTSYALLQRDIESLKKIDFHLVALDEAQNIKNPAAKVSKAACELKTAHRLCLSGTPIENHLGELWSLMRFLLPGFLGSQEAFRTRFQGPIEKDADEDRKEDLKRRVAPLILRRTKDEVASELPPKTILVHPVELTTGQKDLYETVRATMDRRVRQAIAAQGLEQSRIVFLDALLKLRQICCDPRLLAMEEAHELASAKLDYLGELLGTLLDEGRRVLLFSQFTTMLNLIGEKLGLLGVPYLE